MRGWTLACDAPILGEYGYPAHAGMDPAIPRDPIRADGLPRPCGDGPDPLTALAALCAVTPPMRGWTLIARTGPVFLMGYPAHAGMDRRGKATARLECRLPRPCGDGPTLGTLMSPSVSVTPPMRGWTLGVSMISVSNPGYPAHAGMDLIPVARKISRDWLPRPCGDGPQWSLTS